MNTGETIVAISSSVAPSARIIVRLSGERAVALSRTVCPALPAEAAAARYSLSFSGLSVSSWVYLFRSPRSYTGEDLVEFHLPGSAVLARMLVEELTRRGARPAEAGEFTARAYFNGRIDLTAAEGVAATIHAQNEAELLAARQLLAGELSRRLKPLTERVAETLALVEAGIDFSDEDVSFISCGEVARHATEIEENLTKLVRESARFERLSHEPRVVLVGRPNAGKSTLLNALARSERAVVSPIAGTTRDAISAEVVLDRGIARVIDAAGLEENLPAGGDLSAPAEIARQMRARALSEIESADVVVLVKEAGDPRETVPLPRPADLRVISKVDTRSERDMDSSESGATIGISALTGRGMDDLRERLSRAAFGSSGGSTLALNARHRRALEEARTALNQAARLARDNPSAELLAMELREALDALGRVIGQVTPDDVLGRVFATFCIGK